MVKSPAAVKVETDCQSHWAAAHMGCSCCQMQDSGAGSSTVVANSLVAAADIETGRSLLLGVGIRFDTQCDGPEPRSAASTRC